MNGLFWRLILHFGTEDQKRTYRPKPATGEIWAANSLTDPEAGTGKDYVLNGRKWLITSSQLFHDTMSWIKYMIAPTGLGFERLDNEQIVPGSIQKTR